MESIYLSSTTHLRPCFIPLMMRQMGCTRPHQFQQKMLLWSYSKPASLSNISLQKRDSLQGNLSDNWVLHGDMTTSSALDPACSRYLLTGLMNGTLMVHDTHCTKSEHIAGITRTVFPLVGASPTSNRTKNTLNAGVRCVQWYPHDNGLFCSSISDQIKIWDAESMCEVLNFSFEQTEVKHFAMAPVGTIVAVASSKGEVHLCDLRSGASCHKLSRRYTDNPSRSANCIAWHPTQTSLLATGYGDGSVLFWDVRSARKFPLMACLPEPDVAVLGAAFSSNGRRLVTHSRSTIHSWDPFSVSSAVPTLSSAVNKLSFNPKGGFGIDGHLQAVSLAEDSDLVFACFGCEVIVHDLTRDRPVQQLRGHLGAVNGCVLDSRRQRAFTFARDGNLITWQFSGAPTNDANGSIAHSYCRKSVNGDMVFELINSNQFRHYLPWLCSYGNYPEVTLLPGKCYSCTLSGDKVKESTQASDLIKDGKCVDILKSAHFEREYGTIKKRKLSISLLNDVQFNYGNSNPSHRGCTDSAKTDLKRNKLGNSLNLSLNNSKSSSSHSRTGGCASPSKVTSDKSKRGSCSNSGKFVNNDTLESKSKVESSKERTSSSREDKNRERGSKNESSTEKTSRSRKYKNRDSHSSSSSAISTSSKCNTRRESPSSSKREDNRKHSGSCSTDRNTKDSSGSAIKDKTKSEISCSSSKTNRVKTGEENSRSVSRESEDKDTSNNRASINKTNCVNSKDHNEQNASKKYKDGYTNYSSNSRVQEKCRSLSDRRKETCLSLKGGSSSGNSSTSGRSKTTNRLDIASRSGESSIRINTESMGTASPVFPSNVIGGIDSNIVSNDNTFYNTVSTTSIVKPMSSSRGKKGHVSSSNLLLAGLPSDILNVPVFEAGMPDEWSSDDD